MPAKKHFNLICSVEGCIRETKACGMCHAHYKKKQLFGDPLHYVGRGKNKVISSASLRARFDAQHRKGDGCWLWTGRLSVVGYGQIKQHYQTRHAHRVSYELNIGPIPPGLVVCHTCDVRACVNPDHLWLGTFGDNNRDREAKGRGRWGPNAPSKAA